MRAIQFDIVPFRDQHQAGVDLLMSSIAGEFEETIFNPYSKSMKEVSLLTTDKYWVALIDGKVIGTVGFTALKNNSIALKRMFLNHAFRGRGIAKSLLDAVISWSVAHGIEHIYLGTMTQFIAAHRFYERNGFRRIMQADLPIDFPTNSVDALFYLRAMNAVNIRKKINEPTQK